MENNTVDLVELVRFIASALVDQPQAISVTSAEEENAIVLTLRVAPEDMGKVIGRQGRIAKALRTVVKGASSRLPKKVVVDIA